METVESVNLVRGNPYRALPRRDAGHDAFARTLRQKIRLGEDVARFLVGLEHAADDVAEVDEHLLRHRSRGQVDDGKPLVARVPEVVAPDSRVRGNRSRGRWNRDQAGGRRGFG